MALSAALKARLERLYREGEAPYADLVTLSGLDRFAFQKLVRDEGWGARAKSAAVPKAAKAAKPLAARARGEPGRREEKEKSRRL